MPPKGSKKRKYVEDDDEEYHPSTDQSQQKVVSSTSRPSNARSAVPSREAAGSSYFSALDDAPVVYHDYSTELRLKPDHPLRPIWITQECLIYLEAFSPLYQQASDFLVAIAEPESRPEFVHTYKLTQNSLYAAVAVSINTETIIKVLNRLCKTNIPEDVVRFIHNSTYTFGKAKIVLKENKYFIESQFPDILKELLKNPKIRTAREFAEGTESSFLESTAPVEDARNTDYTKLTYDAMENEEEMDQQGAAASEFRTVSFQIKQTEVQVVKRSAKEDSKYPLMEEYDFKNDHRNPNLVIDLRASTKIRPYQEKSLAKMFGNGRARSGIIVLPCGAGKSLTGVTAASTVKKNIIVMCINNASVKQWREEFTNWTNIARDKIKLFTSSEKDVLPNSREACVVISTYSMICHGGRRSQSGELMIRSVREREWGLMILDEVHVAPADMFQKVVHMINAHCKLGLTATLVREDNKIQDLAFLVGPKLYEANWIDLTAEGYLAKVQCVEVWCPMTKEFYAEYINNSTGSRSRMQRLLYTLNPRKIRVCEKLVKEHSARGDKIIIFSDDVPALIMYCEALKAIKPVPYIYGGTPERERSVILSNFKTVAGFNCIGLSKVGDTALDIPEANVIIQVSSHFGARRQEAQRLGRILRPKPNPSGEFNAFFYTLISTDTKEMYFSSKRQQYLIDQGYTFKVQQDLADQAEQDCLLLRTKKSELELLVKILNFGDEVDQLDREEDKVLTRVLQGEENEDEQRGGEPEVKRRTGTMSGISGATSSVYTEF